MDIDLTKYYGLISPRPTVCVSTVDEDGNKNTAPYSFITPISFEPPLVVIGVGEGKDSLLNAREVGDFVISPVTEEWMYEGVKTAESLPREESEFDSAGLTPIESKEVNSPSVSESPINIECEYYDEFEVGDHILLVGEVVNITADDSAIKNDRIALEKLGAVGHVSGEEFTVSTEVTKIDR
ncbi:flavin reductase family protein [Methanonatronarchaeum sp. AMET6-2]|uniref:flavin reductase family protein n=1 Tax=Methanonatronarchaeum sp. AMET6-2 TaxID=2933293 RepID=UPI0011F5D29A|nr:flavin reductase family protein [Methanonatronarchaeum sp. AMET6-2]RZN63344.1 MAG: flavin reductase family protein [Methanonatronarchaeia archaeon]UOY10596.1 flavin reductase family protein [Methanonatronarchaeum sp. AMET6-2]